MSYWTDVKGVIRGSIKNKASVVTILEEVFDGYDLGYPYVSYYKPSDSVNIGFVFDSSDSEAIKKIEQFTNKLKQHKLTYDLSVTTRFHN